MSKNINQILSWDKPKKAESVEEWKKRSADGAPPGVYHPNMSQEDNLKWKAKKIGGEDPRVEIRKSFYHSNGKQYPNNRCYASQCLIVVRKKTTDEPQVLISTNGKMGMTLGDALDLNEAIKEALEELL